MVAWSNWSGRHKVRPAMLHFVRSEEDAAALVLRARELGHAIRIAGAGHSHSLLVPHDGVVVDTSGLAGVISTDAEALTATVWAGSRIYSLGRPLHDAGLGLKNQGDIDRQAIAGACGTGTHGTGRNLKNLSASVLGARIVLASGDIVDCSADEHPDVWQAARLSLGALGIVTRLTLSCRESYRLRESGFDAHWDDLVGRVPEFIEAHERFEFFWYPQSDEARVKVIDDTTDAPEYPLAEEGSRVAWNYEVLPSHRPHFHTEMEYSIPAEHGVECLAEIRELLRTRFTGVAWPVEYRTVAEDDVWMSMAYGRPTVTISVHQDIREDERAYFEACEAIFTRYGGRPHWGKVNYLDKAALQAVHPRWDDWWRIRNALDPDQLFLNDYMKSLA